MSDTSKVITRVKDNYTKSGVLPKNEVNRIGDEINKLSMSQDLTKTPTGYRYGSSATGATYPFQVTNDSSYSASALERRVAIRGGLFEVITFQGSYSADGMIIDALSIDEGGVTGSFTGSGSLPTDLAKMGSTTIASQTDAEECRWVYLIVGSSDIIGELAAGTDLFAYVSTTNVRPDEDTIDNPLNAGYTLNPKSVKVLAKVLNLNGKLTITQEWTGGDIKEVSVGVDSYDGYHRAAGDISQSISYDVYGRMSLYGFAGQADGKILYAGNSSGNMTLKYAYACLAESSESAKIEDVVTNMGISGTSLVYTDAEYRVGSTYGLNDGMANFLSIGAASLDLTPALDEWWDDPLTAHTHPHEEHTFNTDDHDTAGVDRYIINDGIAGRNNMSGVIGDNAGTPADSIRPNARQLAPVGGVGWALDWAVGKLSANAGVAYTLDWINRKLGGGFWTVEDTTDAGVGTGALVVDGGASIAKKLRVEDTTDAGVGTGSIVTLGGASVAKKFRVEDTTVVGDGTGAIVTLGGGYFAKGVRAVGLGLQAGGWFNTATEQALLAFGGIAGTFAGTGSSVSLGVTATSGMAVNVITGDYYHNSLQGVTGDGFSGGIKVDEEEFEEAIEKQIADFAVGIGLL